MECGFPINFPSGQNREFFSSIRTGAGNLIRANCRKRATIAVLRKGLRGVAANIVRVELLAMPYYRH